MLNKICRTLSVFKIFCQSIDVYCPILGDLIQHQFNSSKVQETGETTKSLEYRKCKNRKKDKIPAASNIFNGRVLKSLSGKIAERVGSKNLHSALIMVGHIISLLII